MPNRNVEAGTQLGKLAPIRGGFTITPDDNNDLPRVTRAIWVGVAGDIAVTLFDTEFSGATPLVYKAVPVGWFPVEAVRVHLTNTTASELIGSY